MTTKFTGDKANITFNSVDYYCLQDTNVARSIQEAAAQCSSPDGAITHRAAGAQDATFTVNLLLDKGNSEQLNNLGPGTTGPFEFHPEGPSTTGDIEYLGNVIVTQSTEAYATGSLTVQTVTFGIDGAYTIQDVP